MKWSLLILSLISLGAMAGEAKSGRHIASSQTCIRTPTVECRAGFLLDQNAKGCFVCVPDQKEDQPYCIKSPTIECNAGYKVGEDEYGCFHCVKSE